MPHCNECGENFKIIDKCDPVYQTINFSYTDSDVLTDIVYNEKADASLALYPDTQDKQSNELNNTTIYQTVYLNQSVFIESNVSLLVMGDPLKSPTPTPLTNAQILAMFQGGVFTENVYARETVNITIGGEYIGEFKANRIYTKNEPIAELSIQPGETFTYKGYKGTYKVSYAGPNTRDVELRLKIN